MQIERVAGLVFGFVEDSNLLELSGSVLERRQASLKLAVVESVGGRNQSLGERLIQCLCLSTVIRHRAAQYLAELPAAFENGGRGRIASSGTQQPTTSTSPADLYQSLRFDESSSGILEERVEPDDILRTAAGTMASGAAEPCKNLILREKLAVAQIFPGAGHVHVTFQKSDLSGDVIRFGTQGDRSRFGVAASFQRELATALFTICRTDRQLENAVREREPEPLAGYPQEVARVLAEKRVDHPQRMRLPDTVGTVQERDPGVEVEIDPMVVDTEQPLYFNALEADLVGFVHGGHVCVSLWDSVLS